MAYSCPQTDFSKNGGHLKRKLDDVDFNTQRTSSELKELREQGAQIAKLCADVDEMRSDIKEMRGDMQEMRQDVTEIRQDIKDMRADFKDIKADINIMKHDIVTLKQSVKTAGAAARTEVAKQVINKMGGFSEKTEGRFDRIEACVGCLEKKKGISGSFSRWQLGPSEAHGLSTLLHSKMSHDDFLHINCVSSQQRPHVR